MTRDDIIRIAREVGLPVFENGIIAEDPADQLHADAIAKILHEAAVRFFEVAYAAGAAAERDGMAINSIHSCHSECQRPICVLVREAVELEREACAKVGDRGDPMVKAAMTQFECAAAIRARGSNV